MFDLSAVLPRTQKSNKLTKPVSLYRRNLILFGLIILFGIVYLFEINALSTKGYEIKILERKVKELEIGQRHLEIQTTNLQSISRIQQSVTDSKLVPVTNVTYIKDSDFALK